MIYPVVSPRSPDYFFPPWFTNDASARPDRRGAHGRRPGTTGCLARDRREPCRGGRVHSPVHRLQLPAALLEPSRLPGFPAAVQRSCRPRLALPALTGAAATLVVRVPELAGAVAEGFEARIRGLEEESLSPFAVRSYETRGRAVPRGRVPAADAVPARPRPHRPLEVVPPAQVQDAGLHGAARATTSARGSRTRSRPPGSRASSPARCG